jgi:hypothetical protein
MHPLLPTPHESLLLAVYPTLLLLGCLYTTLSPPPTGAVYSPVHQSYQPPALAPSYFARKDNALNVFFVKAGWAWTSLALLAFHAAHLLPRPRSRAASSSPTGPGADVVPAKALAGALRAAAPRAARAAARYAACTLAWAMATQWCFGPALIDRSFRLTGGGCAPRTARDGRESVADRLRNALSRAECAVEGGTWSGGIDVSGHVFMLTLGSAMLCLEVLPVVVGWWNVGGRRPARAEHAGGSDDEGDDDEEEEEVGQSKTAGGLAVTVKATAVVVGLSWWMLLMTAAFFHTWSEKLAGLIVAFTGIWIVYFLPRGVEPLRLALGVPGG